MKLLETLHQDWDVREATPTLPASAPANGGKSERALPVGVRPAPAAARQPSRVADVMNRVLVTVRPTDPVPVAARRLRQHGRTGLPVVDAQGRLVGWLAEATLLARLRPRRRSWWRGLFEGPAAGARAYQLRAGQTVAELMGAVPAPVDPAMAIQAAAEVLAHDVREVPVVAHGRLVGTVSRTDLLPVVADAPQGTGSVLSDGELVQAMRARLAAEDWVTNRGLGIDARAGVLHLYGLVEGEEEKAALSIMARSIDGCRGVENGLVTRTQLRGGGAWV